jgi:small subunit ribosomal protein S25e
LKFDFEAFWTRLHELMLIPFTVVQGKGYVITLAAETTSFNTRPVKDKAQHAVILDKATSDKLYKDVQSYRLITVATLVDRLKINGSLARRCLADLEEKGQIKKVVGHSKLTIYSTFPCLLGPLPNHNL